MEDSSAEANPGTPAPYGQACANCVRAKCKCIVQVAGRPCVRCERLQRECTPSLQVRKRGMKRKATSRREGLEDKLDSLVTLLQAQQSTQVNTNDFQTSKIPLRERDKLNTGGTAGSDGSHSNANTVSSTDPSSYRSLSQAPPSTGITPPRSNDEFANSDQRTLQVFREIYLKGFPFTSIPPTTTVEELRQDHPFLWLNIKAICTGSVVEQMSLGRQIRESLGRLALVEGERSLDLLQGLLTHLTWLHYFSRSQNATFLAMLAGMARSLASDLRLDEPAIGPRPGVYSCAGGPMVHHPTPGPGSRTHEQRRALVSCFSLCSIVASSMHYEIMEWTPQIEDAATKLYYEPKCVEDQVLSVITRISAVANEATRTIRRGPQDLASMLLHIKPLRAALDSIKSSLSPDLLANVYILSYLYNTEALIHEAVLYQKPSGTLQDQQLDIRRYEYLHVCLNAAKSCLDNYIPFATPQHSAVTYWVMLHCLHGLQILYRLSTLVEPGWDVAVVRRTADLFYYLDKLIEILAKVHDYGAPDRPPDQVESVWTKGAERLRLAIPAWVAGVNRAEDMLAGSSSTMNMATEPIDPLMPNFSDDSLWFGELFSPNWNMGNMGPTGL